MLQRGRVSASRVVRVRTRGLGWGFRSRMIVGRSLSILTGECEPPVSGTFHRSQVDANGRAFNFATVVINSMEKGQSALPAWSQACSLVGTSTPTLAVAFVSKHTPSSAAAVEEIGRSFSELLATEHDIAADAKFNAPFIGCIADLWNVGAPASTSPGAGGERKLGVSRPDNSPAYRRIPVAGAGFEANVNEVKSTPAVKQEDCTTTRAVSEYTDDDNDEEDFKALVGECARWTRENPGAISDEETVVSLDKELKASGSGSSKKKTPPEEKSEALALEQEEMSLRTKPVVADVREVSDSVAAKGVESASEAEITETVARVEGASSSQTSHGMSSDGRNQASQDDSSVTIDDEYRMILCVAHMPETKAVVFHTTTTGLPHLPDMEAAVTKNNPHMILLGAPGYPYPEFVQRLSTIFPESCRLQSRCISGAFT